MIIQPVKAVQTRQRQKRLTLSADSYVDGFIERIQGSKLTVDRWTQASKNSPERLRASKKETSTGPTGPVKIWRHSYQQVPHQECPQMNKHYKR